MTARSSLYSSVCSMLWRLIAHSQIVMISFSVFMCFSRTSDQHTWLGITMKKSVCLKNKPQGWGWSAVIMCAYCGNSPQNDFYNKLLGTFEAGTVQNGNKGKQSKLKKMSLHRIVKTGGISMTENPSEMIGKRKKSCCWRGSSAGGKNTGWVLFWHDQSLLIHAWLASAAPTADLVVEGHHSRGLHLLALNPKLPFCSISTRYLNHSLPLCQASSLFEVNVSKLSVVSLLIRKRSEWLHF